MSSKKKVLSVLVGAQMYKKERLRNIAKKSSKKENGNSPLETSLLLLLRPICSSFSLWEALLVVGNEVVMVEFGGGEDNKV